MRNLSVLLTLAKEWASVKKTKSYKNKTIIKDAISEKGEIKGETFIT